MGQLWVYELAMQRSALRAQLPRMRNSRRKRLRASVVRRWGGRCFYCGSDPGADLTLDHLVPRSRGGTDSLANLLPACKSCNAEKGSRTFEEYRDLVARRQPAWLARESLAQVLAQEGSLGRPEAYRVLRALARVAGAFEFPGCTSSGKEPGGTQRCEVLLGRAPRRDVTSEHDTTTPMGNGRSGRSRGDRIRQLDLRAAGGGA